MYQRRLKKSHLPTHALLDIIQYFCYYVNVIKFNVFTCRSNNLLNLTIIFYYCGMINIKYIIMDVAVHTDEKDWEYVSNGCVFKC